MSQKSVDFYHSSGRALSNLTLNWKDLAKIDSSLTSKWVDSSVLSSHKIDAEGMLVGNEDKNFVQGFLDGEYGKSMMSVDYKPVSYLPSGSFDQIGLFAKSEIEKGAVVNGIIGVLAELAESEIIAGFNDVSVLYSKLRNVQWLMLGPISFVNASCRPNVEYRQKGKVVYCVALKNIAIGEELSVFYNRHFFGRFNVDCLCPFKREHGDPCPSDPEPFKKRKKNLAAPDSSTPVNVEQDSLNEKPIRKIFIEKLPPRRMLYANFESTPIVNEENEEYLSYDSFFGEIELTPSPIKDNSPAILTNSSIVSTENSNLNEIVKLENVVCSTPLRLDVFEVDEFQETIESPPPSFVHLFQDEETPLFDGSPTSTESFMKEFELLSDKHRLSKVARNDFLKLFAKNLPVPNNMFSKLAIPVLPTISTERFDFAKFCSVDIKTQLELILSKNVAYIKNSWSSECSWNSSWNFYLAPEIQLVLNIDGAPLFKSSKISVWPVWVQIFNLPPKLRGSFANMTLLGLWHGKSKPDFSKMLPLILFELESLNESKMSLNDLGALKFRIRSIVADMPAKACVLCMVQFNGYSSCPHCYIKGFAQNHRMLFSVNKSFKLRENADFQACGYIAEKNKTHKCGVKSFTPLNSVLNLPWECPIDPMHQVFIGTGKVLTKLMVSLTKGVMLKDAENFLKTVNIPFDIQHKLKSLSDIKFWKAFDFKVFFFHVGPLIYRKISVPRQYYISFCLLSIAIRLLSEIEPKTNEIDSAECLIENFFSNFLELYGEDSQSFNFHTMRHLCEQVKRNGPLWFFSAFCFESANHHLLSAVQGTVKEPQAIVEQFIKHQVAVGKVERSDTYKCLKGLTSVDNETIKYCQEFHVDFFFSRYINGRGQCFGSLSYTRVGQNLSECIFQLSDGRFFFVRTYFSGPEGNFAVGRYSKYANEVDMTHSNKSFGFFFELFGLGSWGKVNVYEIKYKTVVLREDSLTLVSVIKEGFEHN